MANGSVIIDVTANTKPAEKDISQFKNDIDGEDIKFDLVEDGGTQRFEKQIEYLEIKANDLKEKLRQMDLGINDGDIFKTEAQLEQTTNRIVELKRKQQTEEAKVGTEIDKNTQKQKQLDNETKKHHLSLDGILKKVTRWGMAIIGVRSAYSLIRGAVSMVAGSNEQIANKMEQMRNVIANAVTPLVETIVNLLMKAMVYINYITKALFGKAIFDFTKATGNASKNMASTQKSASGTAKALKQASKQLAGFDEMNVLSDNTSSGGGGTSGVGGVGGLDMSGLKNDFEDLTNMNIPDWVDSIAKALEYVVAPYKFMIEAILEKIRLDKIDRDTEAGRRADNKKRKKSLEETGTQIIKNSKAQKQMTDQEFIYIRGIEEEIYGLMKKGKLTDSEKERLRILKDRYGDLYREGVLNNSQTERYNIIVGKTKVAVEDFDRVMGNLTLQEIGEYEASKNVADGAEQVANTTKGGITWVDKYGVTLETMGKKAGLSKEQTDELRDALNKYDKSDKGPVALAEFGGTLETIGKKAGLSKEQIEELARNINGLKSKKVTIEATLSIADVKEKIKGTITNSLKALFGAKGMVIGYNKGGIIKYAKGGIINRPSKGVPLPIGGEHGMEGVVPLTDSQQMMLLGEAIGKYITINANITNSMNGRVLSRELQKIQNEQSFASNRW